MDYCLEPNQQMTVTSQPSFNVPIYFTLKQWSLKTVVNDISISTHDRSYTSDFDPGKLSAWLLSTLPSNSPPPFRISITCRMPNPLKVQSKS